MCRESWSQHTVMTEREISNTTEHEDPTEPHKSPDYLRKLRKEIYNQRLQEFKDRSGVTQAKEPQLNPDELGNIEKTN